MIITNRRTQSFREAQADTPERLSRRPEQRNGGGHLEF